MNPISKTIKIKVCGMRDKTNIADLMRLNPDYMGFIFYEKSKRFVDEIAFDFIQQLDFDHKVAVFVNALQTQVLETAQKGNFHILQLHGEETPEYCAYLKSHQPFTLIKAFSIDENFDFNQLHPYQEVVDYFLFDTKGNEYGGNGISFDWNILKQYDNSKPFFLSGGISLENIDELLFFLQKNSLNVHSLDINSKFEIEPSIKDIPKIAVLLERLNALLAN
jgi:phosphoribosylanthranilate isomerase